VTAVLDVLGVAVLAFIGAGGTYASVRALQASTTIDESTGDVMPSDPQQNADDSGADSLDHEALARVSASEAGGQKLIAKAGVCWVVLNVANRTNRSVADVVLGSATSFGKQGTGGRSFVSSAKDPAPVDLDIASGVLGGTVLDPTGGAVNFDSPGAYDDPSRADLFAANRAKEGKALVLLDGVSERTFRFWRPTA